MANFGFRYYPALGEIRTNEFAVNGTLSDFLNLMRCKTHKEQIEYFDKLCTNDKNIGFVNNASEVIKEWINPTPMKVKDELIQGETK